MNIQKVSMPLDLPGIKMAKFTRQIIIINQGIVSLEGFKNKSKHEAKGYLWYEDIQGIK